MRLVTIECDKRHKLENLLENTGHEGLGTLLDVTSETGQKTKAEIGLVVQYAEELAAAQLFENARRYGLDTGLAKHVADHFVKTDNFASLQHSAGFFFVDPIYSRNLSFARFEDVSAIGEIAGREHRLVLTERPTGTDPNQRIPSAW